MSIKKFLIYFFIFNILLAIAPALVQRYDVPALALIPHFWLLFFVFSMLTLAIHIMVHWFVTINAQASGQALMSAVIAKFIFCILLVFIYLSKIEANPALFLLNFFYLYFFQTTFEIYCLLRNLRNQISK